MALILQSTTLSAIYLPSSRRVSNRMAELRNFPSLSILSLMALLILAVEQYESLGSSRKSVHSGFKTDYNGVGSGMCASAVTVHGYKCQEFEVN